MTMPLRDRWRHHYLTVQPDFSLTLSFVAGDGCESHVAGVVTVYCGLICPRISPSGFAAV